MPNDFGSFNLLSAFFILSTHYSNKWIDMMDSINWNRI